MILLFLDLTRAITPICLQIPILTKLDIDKSAKDYHENVFLWK